jgi:hypothetical protein
MKRERKKREKSGERWRGGAEREKVKCHEMFGDRKR